MVPIRTNASTFNESQFTLRSHYDFLSGFQFFMCVTEMYAVLRSFKVIFFDLLQAFYATSLLMYIFRFVWTILFMSKLSNSASNLNNAAVSIQVS